jgi:hypothetical protein
LSSMSKNGVEMELELLQFWCHLGVNDWP